jgi:hypothetical protein
MATTRRAAPTADVALPPLTDPQFELFQATARCIDFEGSIRSGKSTVAGIKLWMYALQHPGIRCLAARWKAEDVEGQLRGLWREVADLFPADVHPEWDSREQAYIFKNGSWVYLRSLKASDEDSRYSKFRGLTLAVVWIDQSEEIPQDVYTELKGRLSQKGFPKQIILTPNSVDEDDWIAEEFPDDGDRPGHRYIRADLWSNRGNLDDETIAGLEQDFPVGHPKRRTMLEGRRGPNVIGTPVYDGVFRDDQVSTDILPDPIFDIFAGWDFGHRYPAVVWGQYHNDTDDLVLLGAAQGREMFLEMFVPEVLKLQEEWFPGMEIRSFCDPNGESPSSHGMKMTAAEYLRSMGVMVTGAESGNEATVRDRAIQAIAGRMFRGRFAMHPRCMEFSRVGDKIETRESRLVVTAFKSGYVWNEKKASPQNAPNVRLPRKGTRYDHVANCTEYIVIGARLQSRVLGTSLETARERHARKMAKQVEAARRLLLERGVKPADPRLPGMERELAGILVRDALRAKREAVEDREAWRKVRAAQRDDKEPFRWENDRRVGRAGY